MKKNILILVIMVVIFFSYASAQHAEESDTSRIFLDEIVFTVNRFKDIKRNVAQQIQVIDKSTINNFNAQTTPDLLLNSGNVSMQKSQQGGGSPVLRGLEANRVLLVVDGVRMNNLIYRAGHLQNAITIDNNSLDRVEILYGASSTVYGTDALGGVVHFKTKDPQLASEKGNVHVFGNYFLRYGTVNNENTLHFDLNIGGEKTGSFTSFTYSDFDDLKMGKKINKALGQEFGLRNNYVIRSKDNQSDQLVKNDDMYLQKFSGYQQYDLVQKFLFHSSPRMDHLVNIQYSNSSDVPRYDRLTDLNGSNLKNAEWYYGPQKRILGAYTIKLKNCGKLADFVNSTISYQHIEESRHQRRFNNNGLQNQFENVDGVGLNIDFEKPIGNNNIRYGIDGQFNFLKSTANKKDIISKEVTKLDTRYPDGINKMNFLAVYATHILKLNSRLVFNSGVRIGGSWLRSEFINKEFFPFPFTDVKQKNLISSGNIALIFLPSTWRISVMGSTGYRVPNVDDLSKVFESASGTVIIPNPNLKPERSFTTDLSITKYFSSKIKFENVFFATRLTNVIITDKFTFNGQDSIVYNEQHSIVMANQNKGKANIYGYSGNLKATMLPGLVLTASLNYTYGRVITDSTDAPLDHISPVYGRVGIQFNRVKFRTEVFSQFNGWKRIKDYLPNAEDNEAYATLGGIPRWYTVNFRVSYTITKLISAQIGVDNLFDLQYRTFSSGINAPGRNIFGTLRINY